MQKNVKNVRLIVLIISLLTLRLLMAGDPPYQAIITELSGEALVKKSTQASFKSAVWGMHLHNGDQIRTAENSQISILFASNNMITLGANSSITISGNSLAGRKITAVQDIPTDLQYLSYKDEDNGEIGILAGLRSGSADKITLLSPRNTKLKTRKPVFRWQTNGDYEQYNVSLFNRSGRLWLKKTIDNYLNYPEDEVSLDFNNDYFWNVEGITLLESDKSENQSFSLVDEEKSQILEEKEKQLNQRFQGSNYYFLIGNLFEREKLYEDALQAFHKISENHPSAPLPHQILGKLYQRIGLKDKAIEELENAVELTQIQK